MKDLRKIGAVLLLLLSATLANATDNSMYQCLDAIEWAERFEIHSNQATYMMEEIKATTFEGQQMTWTEIEEELIKAGYKDYINHANQSPEETAEFDARRALALKVPRIAKLAKKWESEYNSREAFERRAKEQDDLMSRTYTFHRSREGARLLTGIQGFDQRDDSLSPIRPYGLLATRTKTDGQYLYILTREGVRRVKVSDSAETGNHRYVVALKRVNEARLFSESGYSKTAVIALNGDSIQSKWPNKEEREAAGVKGIDIVNGTATFAEKLGANFTLIDYSTAPLNSEISGDANTVFKEELAQIISNVVSAHENQMSYLTGLDDAQKNRISADWQKDEKWLSEFYTGRYTTALQKCADLNIGITTEALNAVEKVRANQQRFFSFEQVGESGTPVEVAD